MTQAQQQPTPVQQTVVPAQPQMLTQPSAAVQYQYQWQQPMVSLPQPAAQAAVVPAQQNQLPYVATG